VAGQDAGGEQGRLAQDEKHLLAHCKSQCYDQLNCQARVDMASNQGAFSKYPQSVWLVPDPLGLYFRVAKNDHRQLLDFISSGNADFSGAVFDPVMITRHRELREQILGQRLEAVLDPMTQQSALPGGYTEFLGALLWGVGRPHTYADFQGTVGRRLVSELGSFAVDHGFTQILAPTHLLRSVDDPWFTLDVDSACSLRDHLDKQGAAATNILYSLAIPYSVFRSGEQRRQLLERLRGLPLSAIWLRVDGFGADSTATAARNYILGASEFHDLGVPIVADLAGGLVGLGLLAFGAVGGISHGITFGERFDAAPWRRRKGSGFRQPHRVYFPALDLMLPPVQAKLLLESSARA
jgi:hypothetical protein